MSRWRLLAIIFSFFSVGALMELNRLLISNAPDIAANRKELIPMAIIITAIVVFFAIRFWKKASDSNQIR
jgi:hypothetical protein